MRTLNSKNKIHKYIVNLKNDDEEIIATFKCCNYQQIMDVLPRFKSVDNVRNYFRYYKGKECRTKKTKKIFGNIDINRIPKVKKVKVEKVNLKII